VVSYKDASCPTSLELELHLNSNSPTLSVCLVNREFTVTSHGGTEAMLCRVCQLCVQLHVNVEANML